MATATDPTIFVQTGAPPRLRKELLAYKQIGLTDYARFRHEQKQDECRGRYRSAGFRAAHARGAAQGVGAPLSLVLGDPTVGRCSARTRLYPSYPMRINSDVRFYGSTYLYESQRGTGDNLLTNDTLLTSGKYHLLTTRTITTRLFVNQPITRDTPRDQRFPCADESVGPAGQTRECSCQSVQR